MSHIHTFRWQSFLVAVALVVSGCAAPGPAPKSEDELTKLREQQSEMAQELQTLRDELARLRGETGSGEAAGPEGSIPSVPTLEDLTATAEPDEGAAALYRQAFLDFSAGDYANAIASFQSFIETQPDNPFHTSARYWLGHCYTGMGQPELAIQSFEQLVGDAPQSRRAPAALVHLATLYQQMNLSEQARQALETLKLQYPESPENRQVERQGIQPALDSAEGKHD